MISIVGISSLCLLGGRAWAEGAATASANPNCVPIRCLPLTGQGGQGGQAQAQPPPTSNQQQQQQPMGMAGGAACPQLTCGEARVHFALGSADIPENAQTALRDAAGCLRGHDNLEVVVEGD